MTKTVEMAFNHQVVTIAIDDIQPMKTIKAAVKNTTKYRQVLTSVREVGVIEHPMVYAEKQMPGKYMLLDGHLRHGGVERTGRKEVSCLIATDDEGFTYNHKISRLAPIQEHFMILKAVEKGVSEERIAAVLNVDVAKIRQKSDLLNGIAPEAAELLKDKHMSPHAIRILRKLKPARQVEVCEIMMAAHNYTVPFAKALLLASPQNQLLENYVRRRWTGFRQRRWPEWKKRPRGWPGISSW